PPTRGTFRLLIGCIATLSLCVYSALHLNVLPPAGRERQPGPKTKDNRLSFQPSLSTVFSSKAKWVLIGMFAPEFVVYTAWSQWRSARKLTDLITSSPEAKDLEWTMTHSFFALMGGFAVDTDDPGEDEYIAGSPRLHLTANGVAALAEIGLLPSISKDFILDKSKADHFTKALVIMQAGWLVIECLGRAIGRLPVSQLELNTIAHIACAFVTYSLWWHKPHDVHHPVVIADEWKRPLVAAMAMFSKEGRGSPPEIEALLHYTNQSPPKSPADLSGPLKILHRRLRSKTSSEPQIVSPVTIFRLHEIFADSKPPIHLDIDPTTLTRWSLACQSLSDHPALWSRFRSPSRSTKRNDTSYLVHEYPESKLNVDFVCTAVPNWPGRDLLPHNQKYTPMAFFSACVVFYGGAHTGAWNDYFPSENERLFWRIAAVYVAGSGFSWFALRALQMELEGFHRKYIRGKTGQWVTRTPLGAVLVMVPLYVITALGCGYVAARVYLVVEAFISLRDVPAELYLTPEWSRYLVHF
ncbi:hypothetical protein B0T14DRAFT_417357, partial [Immersiella caudata]